MSVVVCVVLKNVYSMLVSLMLARMFRVADNGLDIAEVQELVSVRLATEAKLMFKS